MVKKQDFDVTQAVSKALNDFERRMKRVHNQYVASLKDEMKRLQYERDTLLRYVVSHAGPDWCPRKFMECPATSSRLNADEANEVCFNCEHMNIDWFKKKENEDDE